MKEATRYGTVGYTSYTHEVFEKMSSRENNFQENEFWVIIIQVNNFQEIMIWERIHSGKRICGNEWEYICASLPFYRH